MKVMGLISECDERREDKVCAELPENIGHDLDPARLRRELRYRGVRERVAKCGEKQRSESP